MFGNAQLERVRALFADQFEPDGAAFLYRNNMKAAPIQVSAAERDAFVADVQRNHRRVVWAVMIGVLLVIILLAVLIPDVDSPAGQIGLYGAVGGTAAAFLVAHYLLWGSPARALERRPALGAARSREELRTIALAKLSYGQLAFAVLFALVALWSASVETGVFHGWGLFWLIFTSVIIIAAAVQRSANGVSTAASPYSTRVMKRLNESSAG